MQQFDDFNMINQIFAFVKQKIEYGKQLMLCYAFVCIHIKTIMYAYTRANHFNEKLKILIMMQECDTSIVPPHVCTDVETYLTNIGKGCTTTNIRYALKALKYHQYYEHVCLIQQLIGQPVMQNTNDTFVDINVSNTDENTECYICMKDLKMGDVMKKLQCNHEMCIECFDKIAKPDNTIKCPFCCTTYFLQSIGAINMDTINIKFAPITQEKINLMTEQFNKLSSEFAKHKGDRVNFLNFNFVIVKLLVHNGFIDEHVAREIFPQLRSVEKTNQMYEIWNKIKHVIDITE
jgi:hypothetical protein